MSSKYHSETGQSLMEYGLALVFVAVVIVAILTIFGDQVQYLYCKTTHQIAPDTDLSSVCDAPIIIVEASQNGNSINVEARLHDPDGNPNNPYAAIDRVEFYIDDEGSSPVIVEYQHRYCLGGGNGNSSGCTSSYSISSLPAGNHSVIMLAYDNDGNMGRDRFLFSR